MMGARSPQRSAASPMATTRKTSAGAMLRASLRRRCVSDATMKYATIQNAATAPTAGATRPTNRPAAPSVATVPASSQNQRGRSSASRAFASAGGVQAKSEYATYAENTPKIASRMSVPMWMTVVSTVSPPLIHKDHTNYSQGTWADATAARRWMLMLPDVALEDSPIQRLVILT